MYVCMSVCLYVMYGYMNVCNVVHACRQCMCVLYVCTHACTYVCDVFDACVRVIRVFMYVCYARIYVCNAHMHACMHLQCMHACNA